MNDSPWRFDEAQQGAYLKIGQLSAQVILARPHAGWQMIVVAGAAIPLVPAQLWLAGEHDAPLQPTAAYVRGNDMVATYPATPQAPFTTQVYRQARLLEVQGTTLIVLSTLASLNTHLLDAHVELKLSTHCQSGDQLLIAARTQWTEAAPAHAGDPPSGALLRPHASDWSYLELVHPIDFPLFRRTEQGWEHVFSETLEKGVIRRLQAWGVLLPRDNDMALASELQHTFLAAAPPLTT